MEQDKIEQDIIEQETIEPEYEEMKKEFEIKLNDNKLKLEINKDEILYELTESKRVIESHLHISIKHFSYPHSMENHVIQELLKKTGYETATMGYGGTIRKGDNLYKINRRYIVQP